MDRLQMKHKNGGKELISEEECMNREVKSLNQYVKNTEDLLTAVSNTNTIEKDEQKMFHLKSFWSFVQNVAQESTCCHCTSSAPHIK